MEKLYKQAIKRRDEIRDELAALDALIFTYERRQAEKEVARATDSGGGLLPSRAAHRAAVADMMSAAEDMIAAEGRPMTRSELVERLEAAGHKVEGSDKSKVFGTNMWRSRRFLNLSGYGYWPKSVPLPAQYRGVGTRPALPPK